MSFDGLFSILPILVMVTFVLSVAASLTEDATVRMHEQQQFDKIVSIADYVVKQGAVKTTFFNHKEFRYPNWIDKTKLTDGLSDELKKRANLNSLNIALDNPGEGDVCVYRIVVVGQSKEISTLYVCGG
jgi:hypothetical protein